MASLLSWRLVRISMHHVLIVNSRTITAFIWARSRRSQQQWLARPELNCHALNSGVYPPDLCAAGFLCFC